MLPWTSYMYPCAFIFPWNRSSKFNTRLKGCSYFNIILEIAIVLSKRLYQISIPSKVCENAQGCGGSFHKLICHPIFYGKVPVQFFAYF